MSQLLQSTATSSVSRASWGPLLIVVAPLCSDTSSFLKSLHENIDIASPDGYGNLFSRMAVSTMVQYTEESEMKLVVLLFSNSITLAEFRSRLSEIQPDGVLREELLCAVTQIYTGTTSRMEANDVFAYQQKASSVARSLALKTAKRLLKKKSSVICWRESILDESQSSKNIQALLAMAEKYSRVVRFVRWTYEIPKLPLRELMKRSVLMLLNQGHYWDTNQIHYSLRCCHTLSQLSNIHEGTNCSARFPRTRMSHSVLSCHFNFKMSEDGHVHSVERTSNANSTEDKSNVAPSSTKSTASSMQTMFEKSKAFLIPFGTPINVILREPRLKPEAFGEQQHNDPQETSGNQPPSSYPWSAWLGDETVVCPIQGMTENEGNDKWRQMYGIVDKVETNNQEEKCSFEPTKRQSNKDVFTSDNMDPLKQPYEEVSRVKAAIGVRQPTLYTSNAFQNDSDGGMPCDADNVTKPSPLFSSERSSEETSIRKPILRLENPDLIYVTDSSPRHKPSNWWQALFCCYKES